MLKRINTNGKSIEKFAKRLSRARMRAIVDITIRKFFNMKSSLVEVLLSRDKNKNDHN